MSTKNRAIGDTEDEFQAALATYTKAGNKTAAMRRLWNAAYLIGCQGAVAVTAAELEQAKQTGFEEGRRSGFEKGHRAGKKDVNVDAVEVSFAAGKMEGMEQGREAETKRWKDGGHLEDGTCRAIVDSSPPPKSFPLDGNTRTFPVPGAFSVQGFNWADDAEFYAPDALPHLFCCTDDLLVRSRHTVFLAGGMTKADGKETRRCRRQRHCRRKNEK